MKKVFFSLAFISSVFFANAQQHFTQKHSVVNVKYPYTYVQNDPSNSRFYVLPNGLTVILSQNRETPKIQTYIATKAGSKNDPAQNTGLAHYLEHMLFKGTNTYGTSDYASEKIYLNQIDSLYEVYNSTKDEAYRKRVYKAIDSVSLLAANYAIPNEYDKLMQVIGASGTNAYTSFEQTVYVNEIPSNEVGRWLTIEAERFREPILRLFHTELEAVYEEKNISMDNDYSLVFESLLSNLFPNHNYGKQTTIGTVEHLKNPSLKAIRNYYNTYYVPNNMCIIMAGDLDFDATIDLIAKKFAYMQAKPLPEFKFEPEQAKKETTVINIQGPSAEMLFMGYRMPGAGTKQADLLTLADLVLSNSSAGLIDLNLNMSQKVLGAGSSPLILKDYSVHYFYAGAKQGQTLEEVRNLLLEQIENLKNGNFDESLLKGILANEIVTEIRKFEENGGVAAELIEAFVLGHDWMDRLNTLYRLSNFTKQDIMNFAKEYYTSDYVVVNKLQGPRAEQVKMEKPEISKIPVNRDKTSDFVVKITETPSTEMAPLFPDFKKDMQIGNIGAAPFYSIHNPRNDLFELYYAIEMGNQHNKKLSLALEYLEFIGTDSLSASEISTKFYELGCDFGVNSTAKSSYVYLSGLQQNFEDALRLFEHLLRRAKTDDEALAELKNRILKGRENSLSDKSAIRNALNAWALYGAKNPVNNILKNKEIEALKSSELVSIIKSIVNYPHDIVYYGPLKSEQIIGKISSLHYMPTKFAKLPKMQVYKPISYKKQAVYFAHYDMVQAEVTWQKPTQTFNQSTFPVAVAFNEYFGGGMSSIVFQEIREAQALAYSTFARYQQSFYPAEKGKMVAYVGTQSDKIHQAIGSMNDLIFNMPQNELAFNQAMSSLASSIRSERTTKTNLYFTYKYMQRLGLNEPNSIVLYRELPSITLSKAVEFQKNNVANSPYVLTVLASREKVPATELNKYGKVKEISIQQLFGF